MSGERVTLEISPDAAVLLRELLASELPIAIPIGRIETVGSLIGEIRVALGPDRFTESTDTLVS